MSDAAVATRFPVSREAPSVEARLADLVGRLRGVLDGLPSLEKELPGGAPFLASLEGALREEAAARGAGSGALERLARGLGLEDAEVDLLLLAGLAEEHEGAASVLAALHPEGAPWATLGLAAQLGGDGGRERIRRVVASGAAVATGLLRLQGDTPFFRRSVRPAEALWPVLRGADAWPERPRRRSGPAGASSGAGLEGWLGTREAARGAGAVADDAPTLVLVVDEDVEVAVERALALVAGAGRDAVTVLLPAEASPGVEALAALHALARGAVPVVVMEAPTGDGASAGPRTDPPLAGYPGPVVACAAPGALAVRDGPPLVEVRCGALGLGDRARAWRTILPELADEADTLASVCPAGPARAREAAADARRAAALDGGRPVTRRDVGRAVAARSAAPRAAGVSLVRPAVGFGDLVLPADPMAQLREAVERVRHQARVLEGWGFLRGRAGARGVRLLLSGPPGTGKTLTAEVLAGELGVDLLVVDVSRLVSKWIGETEKNLARAFEAAERSQAVLLFDEADALFARRTEVSDANARYANLETAYLLTRLERFDGLAVLATNLRRNVDSAFLRRMEFVVDYLLPNAAERRDLWARHIPDGAPLAPDVDVDGLATRYNLEGGLIRNAAVAAAFLAAAEASPIRYRHLIHAVRREYEKAGRAFPGPPPALT